MTPIVDIEISAVRFWDLRSKKKQTMNPNTDSFSIDQFHFSGIQEQQ